MRRIGRHTALPIILVLAGVSLLVYGAGYHEQSVLTPEEKDASAEAPVDGAPRPYIPPAESPDGLPPEPPPFFNEPPPPPPPPAEPTLVAVLTPEVDLIREVTIGGVVRLDTGELKRTYSGAPPSQCPT